MNTTESSAAEEDKMMSTTNQTETEMDCSTADEKINNLFRGYVLNSVIITVGLSFVVLRRNLCRNCCWGRPGFLQPLSFMDEIGRRWAYAAGFVIIANDILPIFLFGKSHFEVIPRDNEEWMRKYGWLSALSEFFEAMCICLVFYPLLACIDHRHSIAANVVGILYLIPWISTYTAFFCTCQIRAGFLGVAFYHVKIPIYVAFYVVGVSYVLDFVRNCLKIRNRCRKASDKTMSARDITEKRSYKVAHHLEYVVNLLHKRSPEQTDETKSALKAKSKKLIKKAKYEKILGFRYSTRIVASLTVSATLLFWIVIITAVVCEYLIEVLIELCNTAKHFAPIVKTLCEYVIIARILLHVANAVAGLVIMGFLFNTLITYKRRWQQLLRGDHSWHMYGSTMVNPQNTLLNGLKFAGYQAAYAAWGWVVLMLVLSFILVFLTFLLIIPFMNNWLIRWLSRLWPTILLGLITAQVEKLICRFCFLQGNGSVMALDNRRVYNAVSYYFLVLNVILGFFSCMKRILIPFVLGVAFLSRLDRPLIMSGFETKDPGFASFVSMLLVDLYHNHPVVKTFVELMLKVREQREQQELQQQEQQKQPLSGKEEEDAGQEAGKHLRSKMIRNRWLKTLTLVNNPSLAVKVLEQRLKDERKNAEQATALVPATAEDDSYAIEMQPLQDNKETTSSLQVLVR